MSDKVQPIIDQAAAAARSDDNATAAKLWRKAAEECYHGGDKRRALALAACCVGSHMRGGDLDAATEAMRAVSELEAELPGIDDNTAESIRTKRIQLKTMLAESQGRPVPIVPPEEQPLEELQEDPLLNQPTEPIDPPPAAHLTAQEILDRAKGAGVQEVEMREDGSILFKDAFKPNEGETVVDAAKSFLACIQELLAPAGLAIVEHDSDNDTLWGRVVPLAN